MKGRKLIRPVPDNIPAAMTTDTLCAYLDCGRERAVSFGEAAGAKIRIGRCVRWSKAKIDAAIEKGLCVRDLFVKVTGREGNRVFEAEYKNRAGKKVKACADSSEDLYSVLDKEWECRRFGTSTERKKKGTNEVEFTIYGLLYNPLEGSRL